MEMKRRLIAVKKLRMVRIGRYDDRLLWRWNGSVCSGSYSNLHMQQNNRAITHIMSVASPGFNLSGLVT